MARKLTTKMQKVLENIQNGMNDRDACTNAGYSKETVSKRKSKIFLKIQEIKPGTLEQIKWERETKNSPEPHKNSPKTVADYIVSNPELPIELQAGDEKSIALSKMKPHHLAFFKAIASGMSEGEAMRQCGMSETYSRNPKQFKENMANKLGKSGIINAMSAFGLSEENVMQVAMELRHGTKLVPVSRSNDEIIYMKTPDLSARNDFLKFWQKMFELVGDQEEDHSEDDFLCALTDAEALD